MNSQAIFNNMKQINYNKQFTDEKDAKIIVEALKSKLITSGNFVNLFEKKICNFLKVKHAATCVNGTAGLDLAFRGIGLEPKNSVIMPAVNFVASYSMAKKIGAKIYLTDVDPFTGHMRPVDLENCIRKNKIKKINTVVVMHNSGLPVDMIGFGKLKKKYKFNIIEDACHALGAKYSLKKDDNVGNCKYSDISVFSFHPVKSITTGEGGMITTNNKIIFEKLKIYRNHGIVRKKSSPKVYNWDYKVIAPGFNLRLSDFQCALGINQLKSLNKNNLLRNRNFKLFLKLLDPNKFFKEFDVVGSSNYAFPVILKTKDFKKRDLFEKELLKNGIEFRRGNAGGGNQLRQPYIKNIVKNINLKNFKKVNHVHFFGYYIGNYPSLNKNKITLI